MAKSKARGGYISREVVSPSLLEEGDISDSEDDEKDS